MANFTPVTHQSLLFYFIFVQSLNNQSNKESTHTAIWKLCTHTARHFEWYSLQGHHASICHSLARSLENVSLHFHHIGDQLKEFLGSTLKDCSVIFTTNFPLALQISFISIVKLLNSTKKKFFNVHEVILFFLQLFV